MLTPNRWRSASAFTRRLAAAVEQFEFAGQAAMPEGCDPPRAGFDAVVTVTNADALAARPSSRKVGSPASCRIVLSTTDSLVHNLAVKLLGRLSGATIGGVGTYAGLIVFQPELNVSIVAAATGVMTLLGAAFGPKIWELVTQLF